MTHFVLRLISKLAVSCIMLVLLVMTFGQALPQDDEIVFSAHQRNGIYRMALHRGIIAPFISTKNRLVQPDWSPDGRHIAYVDSTSAQLELYIADADGRNQQLLTKLPTSSDYDPQWSPDGRFIVYSASTTADGNTHEIDVMLFDTRTQVKRRLTTTNIFREHMLSWSPDGTEIAFVLYSPDHHNSDIFGINVESGTIDGLISTADNDEYPVWSHDGRFIVFVSGDVQRGLYLLDVTTQHTSLLYTLTGVFSPSDWSQDSRYIYFTLAYHIYKLDVSSCMQSPKSCVPELLVRGGEDARRKPVSP